MRGDAPPPPSCTWCVCVRVRARWWVVESPSTSRVVSVYSGFVSGELRAHPSVRAPVTRASPPSVALRGEAQSAAIHAEAALPPPPPELASDLSC